MSRISKEALSGKNKKLAEILGRSAEFQEKIADKIQQLPHFSGSFIEQGIQFNSYLIA